MLTDYYDISGSNSGKTVTVTIKTKTGFGNAALQEAEEKYQPCSSTNPSYPCFRDIFRFYLTLTGPDNKSYTAATNGYNSGEMDDQTYTLSVEVEEWGEYTAWVDVQVLTEE